MATVKRHSRDCEEDLEEWGPTNSKRAWGPIGGATLKRQWRQL